MNFARLAPLACVLALSAPLAPVAAGAQTAATPAAAPSATPGAPDPTRITGGTYKVDPDHTQVTWTVDHMGFSPLTGLFGNASGTLELLPRDPQTARLEVTIPISSLAVTSKEFGAHLASAEFFDAAKFPQATYRSTKVSVTGDRATIAGDLTLHGVTRPVTLEASFFGAGINPMTKAETIGFTAQGSLRRSEFGLGFAVPVVPDEVKLTVVGAFEKAK